MAGDDVGGLGCRGQRAVVDSRQRHHTKPSAEPLCLHAAEPRPTPAWPPDSGSAWPPPGATCRKRSPCSRLPPTTWTPL
jgi:hypothetical protein